jgi:RimJ/RimL family protein N-acetyltransferase
MLGRDDDAIIITPRLQLHPLRIEDAPEMVIVLSDPSLHEFTGGAPATLDELRDRYARWTQGSGSEDELWLNWIVRRDEDGVAVGTMQATVMQPQAEPTAFVAWTIGTPWQGEGYAGEAAIGLVQWLVSRGVKSVVAHVHPHHRASAAVATRAGLRRTSDEVDGEVVWRLG